MHSADAMASVVICLPRSISSTMMIDWILQMSDRPWWLWTEGLQQLGSHYCNGCTGGEAPNFAGQIHKDRILCAASPPGRGNSHNYNRIAVSSGSIDLKDLSNQQWTDRGISGSLYQLALICWSSLGWGCHRWSRLKFLGRQIGLPLIGRRILLKLLAWV